MRTLEPAPFHWAPAAVIALAFVTGCAHRPVAAARPDGLQTNGHDAYHDGIRRVASDPDGRWFVVRQGYPGETWFKHQGRAAERIDAFAGSDDSGRFAAVTKSRELLLHDVEAGTVRPLRDALTEHSYRGGPAIRVAFSPDSKLAAYVRGDGRHARAVVHRLEDGSEIELRPPRGVLGYVYFDSGSELLTLVALDEDTNQDGRLSWPRIEHSHGDSAASPRIRRLTRLGDRPVVSVVPSSGGVPREVPGLLQTFGTRLLLKREDGPLESEEWSGWSREGIAGPECMPLRLDRLRRLLVIACRNGDRERIAVVRGDERIDTGLERSNLSQMVDDLFGWDPVSTYSSPDERLFAVSATTSYSSGGGDQDRESHYQGGILDLETLATYPMNVEAIAVWGPRALVTVRDTNELAIFDAVQGVAKPFPPLKRDLSKAGAGSLVVHNGSILDLATGEVVGVCPDRWFAIDSQARCLSYSPQIGTPLDVDRDLKWVPAARVADAESP